ncbi:ATP synthase F0 subcomplex A subunit [Hymenobacter daecheongensis DSM 21074]|uniref:ATP synthase subunit a n=1 Tax=Hymenobacter daecheongensis DSM 21074 TaxID=1121955 RepID=A0A1M6AB39_9BACT|nr:F0F1 ATP synthase subunit A [Hymenobacter daecheongensis]SHI33700.1 ATP synthase F0 subcomplex A subunit [Hymenobacter daecheongensis DSM 21074]
MKRLLIALFCILTLPVFANEPAATTAEATDQEAFNPGEMILHHIGDSHEWHFATLGNAEHGTHVTIPLPVIAYQPAKGLSVFSSSKLAHGQAYNGLKLEHEHLMAEDGSKVYDFSITKNTASLILSAVLLLLVFTAVASGYKKNHGKAPKGVQSFFEPIILFIRDEVAKKSIGPKYERYMPYLLTVFFFIWFNNLLGLMPGAANLTGNIAVTFTLAVLTLIITLASSNKYYWAHIFATPGVPKALLPIMIPVELIGIVVKPFSLMVRLFANITAGHIVILSFISLIFIFKSAALAPVSLAFGLFINVLELLVAILQAYIFTLLTAMYIGGAVETHHDADLQMGGGNGVEPAHAH